MTAWLLWGLAAWLFVVGFALCLCSAGSDADDAVDRMWGAMAEFDGEGGV